MLGHLGSSLAAPGLALNTLQHRHGQPCVGQDTALVHVFRIAETECCPYTSSSFPRDHNSWSMGGP